MPQAGLSLDRPIVLVGLMGAGKTTVGRLLAARLALPFLDSDEEIERETGLTIAAIFERFGEAWFREAERRALERLAGGPPRVVAAGGGAFAEAPTRALLVKRCLTVWLDADVATLAGRLQGCGTRPLIAGDEPKSALAALAEERNEAYAQARLHVWTGGRPPHSVVDAVVEGLAERVR